MTPIKATIHEIPKLVPVIGTSEMANTVTYVTNVTKFLLYEILD